MRTLVLLALAFWPSLAWAQPAGVVTTLIGNASVAHGEAAAQQSLKYQDPIQVRDRITTAEQSLVKMLMGGKALVTVRERSTLTITQTLAASFLDVQEGKIAYGVLPQRMQPGERHEIRTPNAVLGVRGTVLIANVFLLSTGQFQTDALVLSGLVDATSRGVPGAPTVMIGPNQALSVIANVMGPVRPLSAAERAAGLAGLTAGPQPGGPGEQAKKNLTSQAGRDLLPAGGPAPRTLPGSARGVLGGATVLPGGSSTVYRERSALSIASRG